MQPAAPCNTTARQQCTQFWVLPALVLLALCTPLASAAREWAAQTWSEHLPRICTAVLLYHAAHNWASSLARRITTLASTQAARHGLSPTSVDHTLSSYTLQMCPKHLPQLTPGLYLCLGDCLYCTGKQANSRSAASLSIASQSRGN